MNCSTIQLQHCRKGQSGIQSSIKHLVQEWAAVLFDVPHNKTRPPAQNTSLCMGLHTVMNDFSTLGLACMWGCCNNLANILSHTHPKKYPECMQFLFIAIGHNMQHESHHFKEAHTDDGSWNYSCSKQSFWKGTKQQTNYTWMSVMECRRHKWWLWEPAAHHPQTQRWIAN
jgi:hypothetical protein